MQDISTQHAEIDRFFDVFKRYDCAACGKRPDVRLHCSWCNIVYCNAQCQNFDWTRHRVFCKGNIKKWSEFIQRQEKFMRRLVMLETMKKEVFPLSNQETTTAFMARLEELTKEDDGSRVVSFEWLMYFLPFVIAFEATHKSNGKMTPRVRTVFLQCMFAEREKKATLTQFSKAHNTRYYMSPGFVGQSVVLTSVVMPSVAICFKNNDPRKLSPCLARYRLIDPCDPVPPMHSLFLLCKKEGCFVFQAYDCYYTNADWCDPTSETARRAPLCNVMHDKDGPAVVGNVLLHSVDRLTDKNRSADSREVSYFVITGVHKRLPAPMIVSVTLFNFAYLFD